MITYVSLYCGVRLIPSVSASEGQRHNRGGHLHNHLYYSKFGESTEHIISHFQTNIRSFSSKIGASH